MMNCFVVWLTDEMRLALFPAGTIVRDPHHRVAAASRVWTYAEPEFRLRWMKLCSSDNHCTTVPRFICHNSSTYILFGLRPGLSKNVWNALVVVSIGNCNTLRNNPCISYDAHLLKTSTIYIKNWMWHLKCCL